MSRFHWDFVDRDKAKMLVRSISMRLSARKKKETTEYKPAPNPSGHRLSISATSIHRIPDYNLPEKEISEEYETEKTLAEGCFARILLAKNRQTDTTVVLKAVHAELTTLKDFQRELHYSYSLSAHPFILCSYEVAFQADNCFIFAQEHAPHGDLSAFVRAGGLPEDACKNVAKQICSALEFLHSKQLVHRDIKLENVLVFKPDLSQVKLCDFGATRKEGLLVSKLRCCWPSFVPPEVYEVVSNERYSAKTSSDVWQFAILIFVCLTGNPPWQKADCIGDAAYAPFFRWQKRRVTKLPPQFRRFAARPMRMFRRMFEHKADKRSPVSEVAKYLKDPWFDAKQISQSQSSGNIVGGSGALVAERKESIQTDNPDRDTSEANENKTRLKRLLSNYGLETNIDQKVLTKRVWDWVLQCDNRFGDGPDSPHCSLTSLTPHTSSTIDGKVC